MYMQAGRGGQVRWVARPISEWLKHQMHASDNDGFVALHYAVQYQKIAIVQKLLQDKCGKYVYFIN